jgi:hypothetical protein
MSSESVYHDTIAVLMELPLVKTLLSEKNRLSRKCKTLRDENKALRNLIRSLPEFRCAHYTQPAVSVPIKTESAQSDVPMQCEPLVDSDDVVYIEQPDQNKPNIVFVIEDDAHVDQAQPGEEDAQAGEEEEDAQADEDEEDAQAGEEEEDAQAGEEDAQAGEEEKVEEEVEEEEVEEEEVEEEKVEEEEDAQSGEEEEVEEEEEDAQAGEEEEAGESNEEVFEVTIKGKAYYTTNATNGIIYAIENDESVGDEIGVFDNGKAIFNKKK